jgi:hypothetical protein
MDASSLMNTALNPPSVCVLKPGLNAAGAVCSSDSGEGILSQRTRRPPGKRPLAPPPRTHIAIPAPTHWASDCD